MPIDSMLGFQDSAWRFVQSFPLATDRSVRALSINIHEELKVDGFSQFRNDDMDFPSWNQKTTKKTTEFRWGSDCLDTSV